MDNELRILDLISQQNQLSQRDISDEIGISLGSVNILLKKMVREGLVKAEKIPANRVVYMLTPQGVLEKINKTVIYIKHHYSAIEAIQRRIKIFFKEYTTVSKCCYYLKDDSYISDAVIQVLKDLKADHVIVINQPIEIDLSVSSTVICAIAQECIPDQQVHWINIVEKIGV